MAAILNFLGALLGVGVANTIAEMLKFPAHLDASHALTIVASALVGAIVWNLITWYFGIPSSSSHALIDRKSTRLNSSHVSISYAVFCLKKKKPHANPTYTDRR